MLKYMLTKAICEKRGGSAEADELGLKLENDRYVLPCGATGRWIAG